MNRSARSKQVYDFVDIFITNLTIKWQSELNNLDLKQRQSETETL